MISSQGHHQGGRGGEDGGDGGEPSRKKRKGNNPSGAKGLLKCERCRKQKQKCEFPDPSQSCVLCHRNQLPCGPKVPTRNPPLPYSTGQTAGEIRSRQRSSVDSTGAIPSSFGPSQTFSDLTSIQTPPAWAGTQPRLSQIVANIESQYPNATLEEVYQLTGNHLQALRRSQNVPTLTPQPQFMSTIGPQSAQRDQGSRGSHSSLSHTPQVGTPVSFPSSINEAGGTQQPQQRRQSGPTEVPRPGGQTFSGRPSIPLSRSRFIGANSGQRVSTPGPQTELPESDASEIAWEVNCVWPSQGLPLPTPSNGQRDSLSNIEPLNPPVATRASYLSSPEFGQGTLNQSRRLYRAIQQGHSNPDSPQFRRPLDPRSPAPAEVTASRRQSTNSDHTTPRTIHPTAPTPNPPGEQDQEIELVDATPPSEPILEDTTTTPSPIYTRANVTWSEEWPMNAPLQPGRFLRGRTQEGRTSTTRRDDLPMMRSNSSSNSEQSGHVTGYGDPMEWFYGIEESE